MSPPGLVRLRRSWVSHGGGRAWLRAWLEAYVAPLRRRRTRVGVELGPWVPGWLLRLALALTVLALVALLGAGPLTWTAAVAAAAMTFARPAGIAPGAVVVLVALLMATRAELPAPLVTAVLLAGVAAVAQWGALLGSTGLGAKIEASVLLAPLPSFLGVQLVVQSLALLGGWLERWFSDQPASAGQLSGWLPLLGVLGLAVLSFGWLPRLGRNRT